MVEINLLSEQPESSPAPLECIFLLVLKRHSDHHLLLQYIHSLMARCHFCHEIYTSSLEYTFKWSILSESDNQVHLCLVDDLDPT